MRKHISIYSKSLLKYLMVFIFYGRTYAVVLFFLTLFLTFLSSGFRWGGVLCAQSVAINNTGNVAKVSAVLDLDAGRCPTLQISQIADSVVEE